MLRKHRAAERGQVMILTALLAVVILGAAALAVDLSVNTFSQRTLQNVSDAAALAAVIANGSARRCSRTRYGRR